MVTLLNGLIFVTTKLILAVVEGYTMYKMVKIYMNYRKEKLKIKNAKENLNYANVVDVKYREM